ncbi:YqaA family protein [Pseudomonas putida]|uniref:DedA family protein n=1 Tax=Pseudomonas putida TaxID=303 RepID=A0A7Y7ZDN8_PSEPU|nr:DedA family protein [Pseudomonas putida]
MFELTSYLGLFLTTFAAATLLPMQSEAALASMLVSELYLPVALVAVATAGNVLGSVVNWFLGRGVEHFKHRRWFPVSESKLERAQVFYQRYGYWSLLLSWVPVIGDPITLVAGVMRGLLWRFILLATLAKGGRYLLLTLLVLGSMP